MPTKHLIQSRYPASSEVVMRMFADPDFHTRKLESMGYAGKYKILASQKDAQSFSMRIERKVPLSLPGMGKSAPESTVVNDEKWNLTNKTGKVVVELKGMPLDASCTTSMADVGGECVVSFNWDIHCKVPLVGGKIEKVVIADMEKKSAEETQAGVALLGSYR